MKVRELIAYLQELPQDAKVVTHEPNYDIVTWATKPVKAKLSRNDKLGLYGKSVWYDPDDPDCADIFDDGTGDDEAIFCRSMRTMNPHWEEVVVL